MIQAYIFDWGDTLMVDFPEAQGKMCHWQKVAAVDGAQETLAVLSKTAKIYVATGAADSTEKEIKLAFERAELSQFISGYFCQENVGFTKGSTEFMPTILARINHPLNSIVMVGDNIEKDIKPALSAGIKAIWFAPDVNTGKCLNNENGKFKSIKHLLALCR